MNTLQEQASKHNPEPQLIANSFKGLAFYLTQFGATIEEGATYIKPLYSYLCTALEKTDLSRHDIPKGIWNIVHH